MPKSSRPSPTTAKPSASATASSAPAKVSIPTPHALNAPNPPSPPIPALTNTPPQKGGWDATTGAIPSSLTAEIEQAFANVDACLRSAGAAKGWAQVYKVNLYTTELSEEAFGAWAASMKKWAGEDHRPLLTGVGVSGLGVPGMRVEIEVVAYVGGDTRASD